MIRDMRGVLWVFVAVLFGTALCAEDVSGIWTGQITGRNGEMQDITFRFKQVGSELTGKMYGDSDDLPISGGKISGGQISFTVPSDFGGGRFKLVFSGTVSGGEMHLTREREGGGQGGGKGRGAKQDFTLKRL